LQRQQEQLAQQQAALLAAPDEHEAEEWVALNERIAQLQANLAAASYSRTVASGNSNATIDGTVEIAEGAELQVAQGSVISFLGMVNLRHGAVLSGMGTKKLQAYGADVLRVCAGPA
jgi:hypothetical protein